MPVDAVHAVCIRPCEMQGQANIPREVVSQTSTLGHVHREHQSSDLCSDAKGALDEAHLTNSVGLR